MCVGGGGRGGRSSLRMVHKCVKIITREKVKQHRDQLKKSLVSKLLCISNTRTTFAM